MLNLRHNERSFLHKHLLFKQIQVPRLAILKSVYFSISSLLKLQIVKTMLSSHLIIAFDFNFILVDQKSVNVNEFLIHQISEQSSTPLTITY